MHFWESPPCWPPKANDGGACESAPGVTGEDGEDGEGPEVEATGGDEAGVLAVAEARAERGVRRARREVLATVDVEVGVGEEAAVVEQSDTEVVPGWWAR